jgi:hypothetical protein
MEEMMGNGLKFYEGVVFVIAVGYMCVLNILSVVLQNGYLTDDLEFVKWVDNGNANRVCYYVCSVIGGVVSHKFKNVMFCKFCNF